MNQKQISDILEILISWLMKIPTLPILILIFIISLVIGVFMIINPAQAIEMQRRFYARINWKIEPISMKKEVRNTRIMGCFLIIVVSIALFLTLANKTIFL